jgi:8-oxo-dGTP pyrophosphatase MutT (NUDIX family)
MASPDDPKPPAPQGEQPAKRSRRRRRRRRKPADASRAAQQQPQGGGTPTSKKKRGSRRRKKRPSQKAKHDAQKSTKGGGASRKGAQHKVAAKRKPHRRPKIPTTREVSAGGVLYRRGEDGIEVVLASRRTRRGQLAWGLAKGGIETGETKEDAAVREVREETGLTAEIEADLGDTKYMYVWDDIRIRKTVHFFLMRHTGGDVDDRDDEMEEIRWFPLDRAIKRAAYRGERDMLVKASELLR